tara:strand:- start:280 stop:1239 length:960 start_codon:yes stop_codon:yes gene_type:complete
MPLLDPLRQLQPGPSASRLLQTSEVTSSATGLPTLVWGQVGLNLLGTGSLDLGTGKTLSAGFVRLYNNVIKNSQGNPSIQLLTGDFASGSVKIMGDLVVEGSQSIQNVETFRVEDSVVELNYTGSTALAGKDSGLKVGRNGATDAQLLWDESKLKWSIDNGTGVLFGLAKESGSDLKGATLTNTSASTMDNNASLTFSGTGEVLGLPASPTTSGSATSKQYVEQTIGGYLRKQYVHKVNSITIPSTASFNSAVTASAPAGFEATNENDFIFFINGQYMEHDSLTIQQVGSTFKLLVDTGSIGYDLDGDDEILAWGKFNA